VDPDEQAALELLGFLLMRPLDVQAGAGQAGAAQTAAGSVSTVKVAAQLAAFGIANLDPVADAARLTKIAAIFADLIDKGLSQSATLSASPGPINAIVAFVKPPPPSP
jgi:hypothetical protein